MTCDCFRKPLLLSLMLAIGVAVLPTFALAQIDPTSGMLLDSTQRPPSREDGLDAGRYTVRPKSTPKKQPTPTPQAAATATPSPAPVVEASASASATATATPIVEEEVIVQATAAATASAQAAPEVKEETKKKAPAYDRRNSILELSLSPAYVYTDSDSAYWYRDYHTSSPGAHLNADVWLTEKFGLHTSFMTTLGASVKDSVNSARVVKAAHNWFEFGFRFRQFASDKPKSSALILGIDWAEYRFTVNPTSQLRHRLLTSGAQLKAGIEFPTSKHYMWTADVSLIPKARHKELDTMSTVKSGSPNETNSLGASLGGVIRIDSGNAYFWRLSHKMEKNVFEGTATAPDPTTAATPSGVSVNNATTMFEIGVTWGN